VASYLYFFITRHAFYALDNSEFILYTPEHTPTSLPDYM
jgi:hypothetical protein